MTRRALLGCGVASIMAAAHAVRAAPVPSIRAIAFDGFVILDPRPVSSLAVKLFPRMGSELVKLWWTRQFEYTWLRSLTGNYADFQKVTEDSLLFAATSLRIDLSDRARQQLLRQYLELSCWPEVPKTLRALKAAGLRLVVLSNMTHAMVEGGVRRSGLTGIFDHILSVETAGAYKPDPRAYDMGLKALQLKKEEILFAAFAGWDAYGAKTFGYPVYWVNRQMQAEETLGAKPDGVGMSLYDLVAWMNKEAA